ncbi:DUF4440 domain-containing protein [Reichenbachiella ulvae]|uniref:DUF4440 domain-containing protein n=1 Tax=Reichenbachiella ulvae TaxID=2980104 RepID=A0ABT3CZ19_9BACT|nr:DUF4440 domain-containing protein [Reichenbachiella ulvae]MCV9388941.1 DUF4440 domain-containing protein [Reichenbachiella ulvae]
MKQLSLLPLFFLISFTACQQPDKPQSPQSLTTQEEEAAKALIQNIFDDIWSDLDSTKLAHYHTDDFYLLEQGKVWGNAEIKNYLREANSRTNRALRTNRMEFISIEKIDGHILMAYDNYADFTRADTLVGQAHWLESAVATLTEQGWKLKMMHSTRVRNEN